MPTLRIACSCAAALFFLFSCKSNETNTAREIQQSPSSSQYVKEPSEEMIDIHEFQGSYELLNTQHFTAAAGRLSVITAEKGLKVTVDPAALVKEDGSVVRNAVHVSIIELTSSEDLFKTNAATVCNGKLLVSGGSYYIGMESDGQKLTIKKGSSLKVDFPKLQNGDMELFYGKRGIDDEMNWTPAGESSKLSDAPMEFRYASYRYDTVYRVDTVREPERSYNYSFLSGRIFRDLNEKIFYYDRQLTIRQLLDTVNKNSQKICLDSVSSWPRNLPKNKTLDTNYLTAVYGPRFQLMLRKCAQIDPGGKIYPYVRKDTLIIPRVESTLAEQLQKYYAPKQVTMLGWLNCDRFYNSPSTEMEFEMPIAFNNNRVIQYFILFKNINGFINGNSITDSQNHIKISQLPVNEEITLIAFTRSNGVIYHVKQDLKISRSVNIPLDFKEISMGEMNKMFGRNVKI